MKRSVIYLSAIFIIMVFMPMVSFGMNETSDDNVQTANDFGEVEVKGLENLFVDKYGRTQYVDFKFKLVNAPEGTEITGWTFVIPGDRDHGYLHGHITEGTASLEIANSFPGWGYIEFTLHNDNYTGNSYRKYRIPVAMRPKALDGVLANIRIYPEKAVFRKVGDAANTDEKIVVQKKTGDKWVDVKIFKSGIKRAVLKGLTPNTKYTLRLARYVPAKDGNGAIYGVWTEKLNVITGTKRRPAIKSIKAYGAKEKYTKSTWRPGYWDPLGNYHNPTQVTGYWGTTYKLKITLKKKPADVVGLWVDGEHVSLKGNSVTLYFYTDGRLKGKSTKVTIMTYHDRRYGGYSTPLVKKVRVR